MDPYSVDDIKRRKDKSFFNGSESEKDFKPLTSQFEIAGTRFRMQFGTIGDNWASVLLRDDKFIATHIYREEDLSNSSLPDQNLIADWVLGIVAIPDINPQEIMKLIQTMMRQLNEK